jgi:glycosyltransferase involved in cell wall biosynthesis
MIPLSAVIITKNEADVIANCLDSLAWAAEIVVLDSGSRDATVEICRGRGCRVISSPWLGFGPTKQLAVTRARHDWVLSVDADEMVSAPLRIQIQETLAAAPLYSGYRLWRVSSYLGRPIRYSGWQRDFPLRLFDRRRGRFDEAQVHETVQLRGAPGTLCGALLHHPYPTLESHLTKIPTYARLGAEKRIAAGKSVGPLDLACRGPLKFIKMYLLGQGFRDGIPGLILAGLSGYAVALKYYLAWEMENAQAQPPKPPGA